MEPFLYVIWPTDEPDNVSWCVVVAASLEQARLVAVQDYLSEDENCERDVRDLEVRVKPF